MCIGCYEDMGSPVAFTKAALDCVPLIEAVYDNNCVGGGMHVQLEDWNLYDENFDDESRSNVETEAEILCFNAMKALSMDERATALAIFDKFISPPS